MSECKHERFMLNLLVEKTSFIYNIVLSDQFNITKRFKNKCICLLVEIQKYLIKIALQKDFDIKTQKYILDEYKILMNRLDYLSELFDNIDGSEDIKNIWIAKLEHYHYDTEEMSNLYHNDHVKNYITDFSNYFVKSVNVKSLKTCKRNNYYNKLYLL